MSLSLFNELKRRNVIKVVAGYLVFAWIVMQVADVVEQHPEYHALLEGGPKGETKALQKLQKFVKLYHRGTKK